MPEGIMPHQVVISPNGRWIASRGNREDEDVVQIWDGATGALLQSLSIKLDIFFAACFSPDSRWLVCNGEQATARLWNIDTEECLQVFQGHQGAINAVVFHPQGEAIITGSDDGTVMGLTKAQKATLQRLGALEVEEISSRG
jgi:WD40 repeat protein